MLIKDFKYYKYMTGKRTIYHGMDTPDHPYPNKRAVELGASKTWWKDYPVHDFIYEFNLWGFRGPEYDEYVGQPVILCMGDSNTVNVGGPIQSSWASQLGEKLKLPCINLGMDGAGNDAIRICYDRAAGFFDVKETFVMYSYFHRRLMPGDHGLQEFGHFIRPQMVGTLAGRTNFKQPPEYTHDENFEYFLEQKIPDANAVFIPPWCYDNIEKEFIKEHTNFEYPEGDRNMWASRDWHHLNHDLNKMVAEYFYELSNFNA